jgi:hypothetical protein
LTGAYYLDDQLAEAILDEDTIMSDGKKYKKGGGEKCI